MPVLPIGALAFTSLARKVSDRRERGWVMQAGATALLLVEPASSKGAWTAELGDVVVASLIPTSCREM